MSTKRLTIKEVTAYAKNAKKHPEKQLRGLAQIVKEIGWRQPVIVNSKGVIIVGHGRFEAWSQFKDEFELPKIWVVDDSGNNVHGDIATTPLSEKQERAYRVADNKLNESEWDLEILHSELKDLPQTLLELTGFGDLKIDDISAGDYTEGFDEEANKANKIQAKMLVTLNMPTALFDKYSKDIIVCKRVLNKTTEETISYALSKLRKELGK